VTLMVSLVTPEREIWSGNARRLIAKTLEGDIGILAGHAPVFGVLAAGSLVRILTTDGEEVSAAVSAGFLSVADDRVAVLARHSQLGTEVDVPAVQSELESLLEESGPPGAGEPVGVAYARALLRAAGQSA